MRFLLRSRSLQQLALGTVLLAGCGAPTSEDVQRWKTTDTGEEPLAEAVKNHKTPMPVRAEASAVLIAWGRGDRVEAAVAAMPLDDRAPLILATVPLLQPLLASDSARAWEAKDALFALRRQATTEAARNAIDAALLPALERDLRAGRTDGPRQSAPAMLIAIGPSTVPIVDKVLGDPKAPFAGAVEVLEKIGDKGARDRGGAALARRARATSPVAPELWAALGTLGGPEAVALLTETVEKGGRDAEQAAEALAKMRRDPSVLPFALRTVGNPATPEPIREQMFAVAENVGGKDAHEGLLALLPRERDPERRVRLYQAALKIGRGQAVFAALEALPTGGTYDPVVVKEKLVKPLVEMGGLESREGIWKAFESKSPVARMIAVLAMEDLGFSDDAKTLEKLTKDRGAVKGFGPRTVGGEATRVAAHLKKQAS